MLVSKVGGELELRSNPSLSLSPNAWEQKVGDYFFYVLLGKVKIRYHQTKGFLLR